MLKIIIFFCDIKAEFSASFTSVFRVTWSFRNHSDMLIIRWSRNISFYYQCWKQFLWNIMIFFNKYSTNKVQKKSIWDNFFRNIYFHSYSSFHISFFIFIVYFVLFLIIFLNNKRRTLNFGMVVSLHILSVICICTVQVILRPLRSVDQFYL